MSFISFTAVPVKATPKRLEVPDFLSKNSDIAETSSSSEDTAISTAVASSPVSSPTKSCDSPSSSSSPSSTSCKSKGSRTSEQRKAASVRGKIAATPKDCVGSFRVAREDTPEPEDVGDRKRKAAPKVLPSKRKSAKTSSSSSPASPSSTVATKDDDDNNDESEDTKVCFENWVKVMFLSSDRFNPEVADLFYRPSFLARSIDASCKPDHPQTALNNAILGEDLEVIEYLLAKDGYDLRITDSEGRTALANLCRCTNSASLVDKALLRWSAQLDATLLNAQDNAGYTALNYAVEFNNASILRSLLALGADPRPVGPDYESPLHLAFENSSYDCARILLNHPAIVVSDCGDLLEDFAGDSLALEMLEAHKAGTLRQVF